jgi:hypothetical protein
LIAQKWTHQRRSMGRPRTMRGIAKLAEQMAREYAARYHRERDHRGLDNRPIDPVDDTASHAGDVSCSDRLGGMLRFDHRVAA